MRVIGVGVDGARSGWVAARVSLGDPPIGAEFAFFSSIQKLWAQWGANADIVLIDMPIGLPDTHSSRECDRLARKLLGRPRSSSVFSPPIRPAFTARKQGADRAAASELSFRLVGKRISAQSWNIMDKIDEVDRFLRDPSLSRGEGVLPPCPGISIREAHPELLFAALNRDESGRPTPCRYSKHTPDGRSERLAILRNRSPALVTAVQDCLEARCVPANRDDVLDAAVCGLVAAGYGGRLAALPTVPPVDSAGLPMEIVYPPDV